MALPVCDGGGPQNAKKCIFVMIFNSMFIDMKTFM